MRILVVEDEKDLLSAIVEGLTSNYFTVDSAANGLEAFHKIKIEIAYDLIVLDIMLPKMNGVTLLQKIRNEGYKMPVLMLTARDAVDDKVLSLDAGADDYLTKPFDFRELLARIRALLRRDKEEKNAILKFKNLILDTRTHEVNRGNESISLTKKEYQILEYLLLNRDRVVEKNELENHLWGEEAALWSDTLRTHIKNLRRKVDGHFHYKIIRTIRGIGYEIRQ
jgi:DNA-binding response OmpR family regulator